MRQRFSIPSCGTAGATTIGSRATLNVSSRQSPPDSVAPSSPITTHLSAIFNATRSPSFNASAFSGCLSSSANQRVAQVLHLHDRQAVVLDLFSRRVVGWSMKSDREASLVMDALMMAVWVAASRSAA
ncbi:MAG: hypothetical protein HC888_10175, partial [Candidatus Competibacteraceae bacterium]|nr:hypothetical protein [Candidatus Competibacteraceae bacterium]